MILLAKRKNIKKMDSLTIKTLEVSKLRKVSSHLKLQNRYFYKYKDDATISNDLGFKGDRDGVSQFCVKQVSSGPLFIYLQKKWTTVHLIAVTFFN